MKLIFATSLSILVLSFSSKESMAQSNLRIARHATSIAAGTTSVAKAQEVIDAARAKTGIQRESASAGIDTLESATDVTPVSVCDYFNAIHDIAYPIGNDGMRSAFVSYPRPDQVIGQLTSDEFSTYVTKFFLAEQIVLEARNMAKNANCIRPSPNNLCCYKGGALERCDAHNGFFCEMAGSMDACNNDSIGCPR